MEEVIQDILVGDSVRVALTAPLDYVGYWEAVPQSATFVSIPLDVMAHDGQITIAENQWLRPLSACVRPS